MLKEGGRTGSAGVRARRWTGVLMVAELTLTVVLLAGAGFMIRNFLTMYRLDLGIDTSQLLTMNLALPERKYPALEQRLAFYEQLEQRLKANPRIESVTITSNIPMQGGFLRRLDDRRQAARPGPAGAERHDADDRSALLQDHRPAAAARPRPHRRRRHDGSRSRGRSTSDFAALHFPNEDPIGRRITLSIDLQGGAPPAGGIPTSLTATIVGIVPERAPAGFQPARSRSDRLPAVQDRSARVHDAAGPQPGRSERDDADPARGSARHRCRPAAVRHPHAGRETGAGALAVPGVRVNVRRSSR